MNRQCPRTIGSARTVIVIASLLAFSTDRPGPVSTFAQPPATVDGGGLAPNKEAGQPRTYAGKVTEKGTGKPIGGATIKLQRLRFPDPETGGRRVLQETTHQTDASGVYRFSVPPEQRAEPNFGIVVHDLFVQ
jgi:hypothetical protein